MPQGLQGARQLFLHAVGQVPPEQWDAYLAEACGPDEELRRQVAHLLQVHREAGSFLERPAEGLAATGALARAPLGETAGFERETAGTVLGLYKLLEQIGEGGMGTVWMAQQTEPIHRRVAVKVIKAGMDSKQVLARFEAERQALALMDHPHIARVLDAGTTDAGRPFFVMELVKGTPITQYCDDKHLTVRARLELFGDVCRAVQHAHQKGIIHRDLKPSNILIAPFDGKPVVKVIDFGVAKATGQRLTDATLFTGFGAVVGTPEYMSPEQAETNNQDIDTRSDIYSLGVLLYELLTGSTPLTRQRLKEAALLEVLRVIREEEPPRPSTRLTSTAELPSVAAQRQTEPAKLTRLVRGDLDWIVMKALEKDRSRRYETANGLARDLERYLADDVVEARPPNPAYRLRKFVHRNRPQVIAASLVLLALLSGVIGTTWGLIRAEKAKADLAAKNVELATEQAKVEARFELAQKAIALFHTGVSEDMLLKNPVFKELRTKLLEEAAGFYADLEKLLAGQTDAKSRKALAAAYFQLGGLTDTIGSKSEALTVHRKALALRRELAAAEGADLETRLDVARSLLRVGWVLTRMGDQAGALGAFEEQRDLAERLDAEYSTDTTGSIMALSYDGIGRGHFSRGKMEEALKAWRKGLATK